MIVRDFEITLRIPETSHMPNCFKVTQNDKDVYNLKVHIIDGIDDIDYGQVSSATITFSKADGNVVQGDMSVGVDSLTYTMGTNEIAHPGPVLASVQLFGADGERLTSARFRFDVMKDLITPSAVQSTSEFPILQRLADDVGDIVALTPEIEQTVQEFPAIRDFFDTAATAETQRIGNEGIRQTQENARQASIADIEDRFDNLTASQQQDAEVIDARDGEASLNVRLSRDKGVVDAHLAESAAQDKLGHVMLPENWITATLENGWTGTLQYRKNDFGQLIVRGEIIAGTLTDGTIIVSLPANYAVYKTNSIMCLNNQTGKHVSGLYLDRYYVRIYSLSGVLAGNNLTFNAVCQIA